MHDVAVFGAAGYAGLELLKLLASHPGVRIACAASDAHAGKPIAELTGARISGSFVTTAEATETARSCAAALLAIPPDAATGLVTALRERTKIVDLSHAHRATRGVPYGLTTLFAADVANAKLVANPGCYATAVITAAAPLIEHALVEGDLVACASSGVTGAGRQATEAMSLGEAYGDVRAYKVLRHQHVPEIEAALARFGAAPRVTLTTQLLPVARGIFATLPVHLRRWSTTQELTAIYTAKYGADPTVTIAADAEGVSLRKVVGTNQCLLGITCEGDRAIVTAAIDNLLKGAAGQAIENLNLMLGMPRLQGLDHLARHA
jgi:N-acetyl-gamma-glutamyl-phosphate reductase